MNTFDYQTRKGLSADREPSIIAWWCPDCSILVSQNTNPVSCTECDGDMTIAPERFQSAPTNNPRVKDDAP
jgi:ABC-type ATPase with predicted acetyltransferase domain